VVAASTTPENRRIFPDAGSLTVTVLIARTVSLSGGGGSLQAMSIDARISSDGTVKRFVQWYIGMFKDSLVREAWLRADRSVSFQR